MVEAKYELEVMFLSAVIVYDVRLIMERAIIEEVIVILMITLKKNGSIIKPLLLLLGQSISLQRKYNVVGDVRRMIVKVACGDWKNGGN